MTPQRRTAFALFLGTALAPAAYAETVKLYTWREQEIPLWEHISENDLIGDVDVEVVWIQGDNYDSKLRIDLGGNVPDLFQGRAGAAWLQAYVDAELIEPVGFDVSAIAPAALAAATGTLGVGVLKDETGGEIVLDPVHRAANEIKNRGSVNVEDTSGSLDLFIEFGFFADIVDRIGEA